MSASGVCGVGSTLHQLTQIDQRSHIDPRPANGHARANHRINHPPGDRHYDARWTQYLEKLARHSLLDAPHANLTAKIGMPAVVD